MVSIRIVSEFLHKFMLETNTHSHKKGIEVGHLGYVLLDCVDFVSDCKSKTSV